MNAQTDPIQESQGDESPDPHSYEHYAANYPLARVWLLMASQFLDSEERAWLVVIAHECLLANLSVDQAREVWRYDVTRAVWHNVLPMYREWAGFDHQWLFERILRLKSRWDNRPGTARWLRYWMRTQVIFDRPWQSIERFMRILLAEPDPEARRILYDDLRILSACYFDDKFVLMDEPPSAPSDQLAQVCARHFRPAVAPVDINSAECEARLSSLFAAKADA